MAIHTLNFTTPTFDAVVVLNGDIPSLDVFEQLAELPMIATDGATDKLLAAGIIPEYIIGDLDSITEATLAIVRETSEIIVDPSQESNDFEKALAFAISQLWERILIVGIHGGDLEHTLNNWSVLIRMAPDAELTVLDRNRYGIPLLSGVEVALHEHESVSLIPQPHAIVKTQGLYWELDGEALTLGVRDGLSNIAMNGNVTVDILEGAVLLFCDARLPFAPSNSHV